MLHTTTQGARTPAPTPTCATRQGSHGPRSAVAREVSAALHFLITVAGAAAVPAAAAVKQKINTRSGYRPNQSSNGYITGWVFLPLEGFLSPSAKRKLSILVLTGYSSFFDKGEIRTSSTRYQDFLSREKNYILLVNSFSFREESHYHT